MLNNRVLLSWVIAHLSKTAADANERLIRDYATAANRIAETEGDIFPDFIALPPPLVISTMKMKFSANVSRGGKPSPSGEMMLEFGKTANFHGEIELTPFGSPSLEVRRSHSGQSNKTSNVEPDDNDADYQGDTDSQPGYPLSAYDGDDLL
ncbi:MAG: hypothetical protein FWB97_03445 [Oscillospiraceae bacterium]|nr:hypothetical protein [Oscillospiraceae bacterium]